MKFRSGAKIIKSIVLAAALFALTAPASAAPRRVEVRGGWYGENLPGGEYAVAVPAALQVITHQGSTAMPAGTGLGPLYIRVSNVGGFKFAGQSHGTLETLEWINGEWFRRAPACGVSPVIYDLIGVLHLSDCSIGSQGWRYVSDAGELITGDATYSSAALKLFEFTVHGDIAIGQGPESGCIAVRGAERRVLEPGDCRFVRFNRSGDQLAVTMVKLGESRTILLWLNVADLSGFPLDVPPPVVVPPVTVPPVPPVPPVPVPPVALPTLPAAVCEQLKAVRGNGPITSNAQLGAMLNRVAWAFKAEGFGLNSKTGGNFCESPAGNVACDILHRRGDNLMFDVFGSAGPGEPTTVNCGESIGENGNSSRPWVAPVDPGGGVPPVVPPVVPPSGDTVTHAELAAALAALRNELEAAVRGELDTIDARIDQLAARPIDGAALGAAIDAALVNYEVNGKTRTDRLGLQHVVQLGISKRK